MQPFLKSGLNYFTKLNHIIFMKLLFINNFKNNSLFYLRNLALLFSLLCFINSNAQSNSDTLQVNIGSECGTINYRNNGNGGGNSCAGVNGTPVATNFVGTIYAIPPSSGKTGDIRINWINFSENLYPPAITNIYETLNGTTTLTSLEVGPPGMQTNSGDVSYCFYSSSNYNLQNANTLTFEYTDPQTGMF